MTVFLKMIYNNGQMPRGQVKNRPFFGTIVALFCFLVIFAASISISHAQNPPVNPQTHSNPNSNAGFNFTPPILIPTCAGAPSCAAICAPFGGEEPTVGCGYIIGDYACDFCEWRGKRAIDRVFNTIYDEFIDLREYLQIDFWRETVEAGLAESMNSLVATAFTQVGMVGTYFDAKMMSEASLAIDKAHIDARRDYQPSTALCKFGSARIGLASSGQLADINRDLMSYGAQKRHLGAIGTAAQDIAIQERARVFQFAGRFCDPDDSDGKLTGPSPLSPLCWTNGPIGMGGLPETRYYNKDINVTDTLFTPKTLNVNFVDTEITHDEIDINALARNLYGYETALLPSINDLKDKEADDLKRSYHELRSIIAKRNVAENSFFTLAGKKSRGSGASREALHGLMEQLGLPAADVDAMLDDAPSYDAQMEILTKSIYQSPHFVTALIDSPENVKRQQAAMLATELMQRRDSYESMLRQEMILAVVLDLFIQRRFAETKSALDQINQ